MNYSNVTVIIPTLNEGKNISDLIKIISSSYGGIKAIVADDGSTDGTKEIVNKINRSNKNVKLLDRSSENIHGLTASVVDAVKSAETEYLVVIDGDLQHPPEKIGEIIAKLRAGNQIVIGTRAKVVGKWPLQRKLMSSVATNLARLRLGRYVKDPMSGFFGMERALFRNVLAGKEEKFEKRGYKVLFDLLRYCGRSKIANVYYTFGERKGGESKIGRKQVISLIRAVLR
ncbi:hypothetical protein CMO88_00690 [Candidatus Woesearchaeota archaeon]|nr:hypothetical protein [Candidatus Woesearchaeota archaeon]|tara:strand:+ start:3614 stop:4300 length:687 start_codon:yes stop_codon:yes gene_type:complete